MIADFDLSKDLNEFLTVLAVCWSLIAAIAAFIALGKAS